MMDAIDIFIAYSQQDRDLMEQFKKQLSAAERIGLVDSWHDGEIEVGTDRELAAKKAMEKAEIVVLLLSANFFASEYLYEKEMTQALSLAEAGKATLIPVLLKECTWQLSPIAKLKILPENAIPITNEYWKTTDRAFKQVVDQIIHTSNKIRKAQGSPELPYKPAGQEEKSRSPLQETATATSPAEKTDTSKTPLWKVALYAFLGLGAFALVSLLINLFFQQPDKKDTAAQTEARTAEDMSQKEEARQTGTAPFPSIKIGQLEWSAQNIGSEAKEFWCPQGLAENCTAQGKLYNYKTAKNICPDGWRLASSDEWLSLNSEDIKKLHLTRSGFSYRGTYMFYEQKGFYHTGEYSGGDEVWVIEYSGNEKALYKNRRYSFAGMSCRCVR